ncbi:MAG TPA: tyrosine-type recombinase/integrase [Streptosporangiaceae bacterium]|nr:tyrosine-type recombinase/integrase [Streptosporangiaceae bacterium]
MKGHVYKRGKIWYYRFDIEPDPLTGKRRQINGSGYKTEREASKACRAAIADYEKGQAVSSSKRKVADALEEWLTRIEHSIKPSMVQNWHNYAAYYVVPYIGQRDVHDIDGAVCDALYAKLLAEGRVKAKPRKKAEPQAVHIRRLTPDGKLLPCLPHRDSTVRCYRRHAENDPAIGQSIEARKPSRNAAGKATQASRNELPPGLEPKTVVNTHRMLHRAWEDFATWGWAKRNFVNDAHPPRVPRKGRKVWNVAQLRTFLQRTRADRFFALWVLEATSGMRRCELAGARRDLLDLAAGTLTIETTRVVVDGEVIESDGKTENAQHVLALDPLTLAVLRVHVEMLDQERREFGPDYQDHGVLFCWENGKPPHPDTITRRFKRLAAAAGLPEIDLHDVRHSYATAGRDAKIDWKALSQRIGHADVAFTMKQYVQTDLEADRQVANTLAGLIIGGALASTVVNQDTEDTPQDEGDSEPGEAA